MLEERASNNSGVISIPPSQYLEGADGSWSTFSVQVGTPGQALRLLPGTSATASDSVWVIVDQGCTQINTNISDCANKRGNLFHSNQSSTWSTQKLANNGLYSLGLYEEEQLGYGANGGDNALYGFDTIELGVPGSGLPTLTNQLVAGIATDDFFLGSLGLSPIPFNFTSFNTPVPSLLGTLRNQSLVNSTTWAYTAGASWVEPAVYGSLTFGGYDSTRLNGTSVQVPFYADQSRDLLLGIQSITFDSLGTSPLLSTGIYAFIDSLVPQMWLPLEVCQQFEQAFKLTYDNTSEAYLLSDSQHKALQAQNPTFTFTVGAQTNGGATTQIKFPYAAFDLQLSPPYVNSTQRYFPLQRAANSSQYTLGRAFLQGAYVIADYDHHVFNISQAAWPSTTTQSQLVAVDQATGLNSTSSNSSNSTVSSSSNGGGLSGGAIAGIVIGVLAVIAVIIGVGLWFFLRRRRRARSAGGKDTFEADGEMRNELEASEQKGVAKHGNAELDSSGAAIHEMQAEGRGVELDSKDRGVELSGENALKYEMATPNEKAQEMATPNENRWELPG